MAEKFSTPKTSLREAINNASGPVALSNRVLWQFAPISFLLVLVSNPSRLSGSYLEWALVAAVGLIATVLVLLGFRGPTDPMHNLMTLIFWTGVWIALPLAVAIRRLGRADL